MEALDFFLIPDEAGQTDDYRFLALADVHVQAGATNTRERFSAQLAQMNRLREELTADPGPPAFVIVAGDLTNDATPAEFGDYLAGTATSDVPVWSAAGNHDLTGRVPGGPQPVPSPALDYRDRIDAYRQAVGPEWYSFQYGRQHFVVLENYGGLEQADQLEWLEQDLAFHAPGKQVIVITHVPWGVPQSASPRITEPFLERLGRYDVRLLLAGHTHSNDVVENVVGTAPQAIITSAASTLDQTPVGYRLVEVGSEVVSTPYGEFDAGRHAQIVHPSGVVPTWPSKIRVDRYRPPGVRTEVEFRVPPNDWQVMRSEGPRAWAAALDGLATRDAADHEVLLRVRDRPDEPWQETSTPVTLSPDASVATPRQGMAWPMFHRDASRSGVAAEVVAPPLDLAWVEHTGGSVLTSSPTIAHDLVLLGVRDEDGGEGCGVVGFDLATGERRWRRPMPGPVEATVAVSGDVVLAPSIRGHLRAFDARTGEDRWEWVPDHPDHPYYWMYFSPAVADGLVYQAYNAPEGAWVVAVDVADGRTVWRTDRPVGRNYLSHGSPAVSGEHLVFATAYANLVALDRATGALRWQAAFGGWTRSMPVIVEDLVLLACQGDRIVAVDVETGVQRWCYASEGQSLLPGEATAATPATTDGFGYAAFSDGSLVALDVATGEVAWRYETGAAVMCSPAVSGDHLYFGSNDGVFRAVDRHSGACRWSHPLGSWIASSPAISGNAVVVAAWNGNLHAFAATTTD